MNSKEFSLTIEIYCKRKKNITYGCTVIWYCDENGLDPSQISSLVSKSLKEKIQVEVSNLNMLKIPKMWSITNLVCMVGLMYIKHIWLLNYISPLIPMTIISMMVKSMQNLTLLQNERIDTFFIS